MMIWQQLRCKHDVNGNPRRLWMRYDNKGLLLEVIIEGYGGNPIPQHADVVQLSSIYIPPSEYNGWIKVAKQYNMLTEG